MAAAAITETTFSLLSINTQVMSELSDIIRYYIIKLSPKQIQSFLGKMGEGIAIESDSMKASIKKWVKKGRGVKYIIILTSRSEKLN